MDRQGAKQQPLHRIGDMQDISACIKLLRIDMTMVKGLLSKQSSHLLSVDNFFLYSRWLLKLSQNPQFQGINATGAHQQCQPLHATQGADFSAIPGAIVYVIVE